MEVKLKANDFIIFDLDDTLYKEIDYLKSAYQFIDKLLQEEIGDSIYDEMLKMYYAKISVFDKIITKYNIQKYTVQDLVYVYRYHIPQIKLGQGVFEFLTKLKDYNIKLGVITDGRSISQRNKLSALNIIHLFDEIVISEEIGSEKPTTNNFLYYLLKFPEKKFTYIGDNFNKDFVTPNKLSWNTIGIVDNGQNIHKQNFSLPEPYLPKRTVYSFNEIKITYDGQTK